MEIDISRIILSTINFIILYLILRHFLFEPVNSVMKAREKSILDRIKKADTDVEAAKNFKSESEDTLKLARAEGKSLIEGYKAKAEKVSQEIISEAKNEAQLVMERARIEVEREREKARAELKTEVADLALMLSVKALTETVDEDTHRKLIKDFILKVGS